MKYTLFIQHGDRLFMPPVVDGVTVEQQRKGQPGKLVFECIKTDDLCFEEGDACRFSVNDKPFFYGFVFEKSRAGSNSRKIKVTVYDQLYYLKNKDYFAYENKTAAEVVRMLAEDFGLKVGSLDDTGVKLSRTEDNKSLFDIIQNALDETMKATAKMYVLYDSAGKLMLSDIGNRKLDLLIGESSAGDFDYKSSITGDTYNKIRLFSEGMDPVTVKSEENIRRWGVLQYAEKINSNDSSNVQNSGNDENDDASSTSTVDTAQRRALLADRAAALLKLYNAKTRTLTVKNVLGDTRVAAGTLLPVFLGLGDLNLANYMLVESVKHSFKDGEHQMELKLRGGNFVT